MGRNTMPSKNPLYNQDNVDNILHKVRLIKGQEHKLSAYNKKKFQTQVDKVNQVLESNEYDGKSQSILEFADTVMVNIIDNL